MIVYKQTIKALGAVTVVTCLAAQPVPAVRGTQEARKGVPGLNLSLETTKTTYHTGEAIKVTTILSYSGSLDMRMPDAGPWYKASYYHFDVKEPYPSWVPVEPRSALTDWGKQQMYGGISEDYKPMRSGVEYRDTFELNRLYHMEQPGDYKVMVWRVVWGMHGVGAVISASKEITITVSPD